MNYESSKAAIALPEMPIRLLTHRQQLTYMWQLLCPPYCGSVQVHGNLPMQVTMTTTVVVLFQSVV